MNPESDLALAVAAFAIVALRVGSLVLAFFILRSIVRAHRKQ